MAFLNHERVYTGNDINYAPSIGIVNYNADGVLQFINVQGNMFQPGDLVLGEDSGYSMVLQATDETIDIITGQAYDGYDLITLDNGSVVALDAHFTGKTSQDYQTTYLVVTG